MIFQVRDIYDGGDYLVLVTTDRQSAFDRILASIPFKGQVCSLGYFDFWVYYLKDRIYFFKFAFLTCNTNIYEIRT